MKKIRLNNNARLQLAKERITMLDNNGAEQVAGGDMYRTRGFTGCNDCLFSLHIYTNPCESQQGCEGLSVYIACNGTAQCTVSGG